MTFDQKLTVIEHTILAILASILLFVPFAVLDLAIGFIALAIVLIAVIRLGDVFFTVYKPYKRIKQRHVDEFDIEDLEFSDDMFMQEKSMIDGKYVPADKFKKTVATEVDMSFVKSVSSKITDALAKKSITVRFKDYIATQQLLTINFTGGDTVNENGTITYFDVQKCEKSLANIQAALGTKNVRFVPHTGIENVIAYTVGITNDNMLTLGNLYDEFKNDNLSFIVGKNINGETVYNDLTSNPHSLIVGATNSGKSSFVRQMIAQLVTTKLPSELEIWASDIKLTELSALQRLPHTKYFADTLPNTVAMLERIVDIMTKRNKTLQQANSPDLLHFNKKFPDKKLPLIVVIIEEFLLLTTNDENGNIFRLLQGLLSASRSAGIYFILATQIANTTVLPTTIRGNLGAKFVFKLSNKSENNVLGTTKAHLLNGNGDALFLKGESEVRVQTPYVAPEELQDIIEYVKL